MYGLKPFHADATDEKQEASTSIEDSIAQELQSMQEKKTNPQDRPFTSVNTGIECVFFLKTRSPPINAIDLTIRMCEDARKGEEPKKGIRTKYINRLVPVVDVDRSSDAGMERLARDVMGKEFALKEALADGKVDGREEFCTVSRRCWGCDVERMLKSVTVRHSSQHQAQQRASLG
jgi:tRNA acetyltransferase TAN1